MDRYVRRQTCGLCFYPGRGNVAVVPKGIDLTVGTFADCLTLMPASTCTSVKPAPRHRRCIYSTCSGSSAEHGSTCGSYFTPLEELVLGLFLRCRQAAACPVRLPSLVDELAGMGDDRDRGYLRRERGLRAEPDYSGEMCLCEAGPLRAKWGWGSRGHDAELMSDPEAIHTARGDPTNRRWLSHSLNLKIKDEQTSCLRRCGARPLRHT